MKTVRILVCVLLLALMVGTLASCGDDETSGAESGDGNTVTSDGASDGTSDETNGGKPDETSAGTDDGTSEGEDAPELIAFQMPAKAVGFADGDYTIEATYEGNTLTLHIDHHHGSYTEVVECGPDGKLRSMRTDAGDGGTVTVEYDENGDPVKVIEDRDGKTKTKEYTYVREYDESGNLTKYVRSGSDYEHYEYAYEGGVLKTKKSCSSEGSVSYTYTYEHEYDAEGNVAKEICYREDGSVYSVFEYEGGILTKSTRYNPGGEDVYYACEYNEYGLVTKRVSPHHGKTGYDDDFEVTEYCTVMLTEEQAKTFWRCIQDLECYGQEEPR